MVLFTPEELALIASAVGIPLYLDKSTEQCRRIDLANVCVEVTKNDPMCSSIEVVMRMLVRLKLQWIILGNLKYVRSAVLLGTVL